MSSVAREERLAQMGRDLRQELSQGRELSGGFFARMGKVFVEELLKAEVSEALGRGRSQRRVQGATSDEGEGAAEGVARDLGRDRLGFEGAYPDGQVPVRFLLFENYQVLGCRHVDANAVHRHLDEVLHPRIHHTRQASGLHPQAKRKIQE